VKKKFFLTSSVELPLCEMDLMMGHYGSESELIDNFLNLANRIEESLPSAFTLLSYSAYSTLICSSETSVDFQRTMRRYIPDDVVKNLGKTRETAILLKNVVQ
jgi:hypothetical protein